MPLCRSSLYVLPRVEVATECPSSFDDVGERCWDLLFELLNRRYEKKSTIITTNKPFAQWQEVFPTQAPDASYRSSIDSSITPKSSLSRASRTKAGSRHAKASRR
jgi:hypothetical protein